MIRLTKSIYVWVGGLCLALVSSVVGQTATIDLVDDYEANPANIEPAIVQALNDAKSLLKEGYESVTLTIPEGTFYCPETIAIRGFDEGGKFTIRGAGRDKTMLVSSFRGMLPEYSLKNNNGIEINDSFNVELIGFHHTRDQLSTTQGHVVAVEGTTVDLEILDGFPCPLDLHRWNIRDSGRYLLRFTAEDKTAPRVDPTGPPQLPWTDVEYLEGNIYRFHCKISVALSVGNLVAVKSKGDGQLVTVLGDSKNITISSMRYTHASRSTIEFWPDEDFEDQGGFVVRDVVIDRPSYLINGWAPCLSTPSDGVRISGNDVLVEDCYIEATGDDGIAFDGGTNQIARGNRILSGFVRGIVAHGSHGINGNILIENNEIENVKQEPISIEQINDDYIQQFQDDTRTFTILENRIIEPGPYPSMMIGIDSNRAHIRVENNWIEKQDFNASTVTVGSAALSISIDNNTIASWSTATALSESEAFLILEDPIFVESVSVSGQNNYAPSENIASKSGIQFNPGKANVSVAFSESLQLPDRPTFPTAEKSDFIPSGDIPGEPGAETVCQTNELANEVPSAYTEGDLLENFEDGIFDSTPPLIHRNLVSDPEFPEGSGRNGSKAMRIEVETDSTGRIIYNPGDLSHAIGLSFWIRSDQERESDLLLRLQTDSNSKIVIEDAVTTEWKRIELFWSDLRDGTNWSFGGDWESISEKLVIQVDNDTVAGVDYVYFDDFALLVPAESILTPFSIGYAADQNGLIESLTLHDAIPNSTYKIQYSEGLSAWDTLLEEQVPNEDSVIYFIDDKKPGFYRIGVFE